MASAKIATLVIRTLAKPISNQIKTQVKQHESFRNMCVGLAQRMHRAEIQLRTRLLGEPAKHVRPLSETKAIENGANAMAEGFLFSVATLLIIGETWRSSRNTSKRRDDVNDRLETLQGDVDGLKSRLEAFANESNERWEAERQRNDELTRILERVVEIGLRGGWAEFEGTPLALPRIQLSPTRLSNDSPRTSDTSDTSDTATTTGTASKPET